MAQRRQPPPRVIIILGDQWPRALLRAAMLQAGYDAVGARSLREALRHPRREAGRGPVKLVVLDQHALTAAGDTDLGALLDRHGRPPVMLLASAVEAMPEGPWRRILRRPVSVGDIVEAAQGMLPVSPAPQE
jgi:hypothetical protein